MTSGGVEADLDQLLGSPDQNKAIDRLCCLQLDFPWLDFQQSTGSVFCRQCVDSGLDCAFSTHVGHEILREHERSVHGQDAVVTNAFMNGPSFSAAMDQDSSMEGEHTTQMNGSVLSLMDEQDDISGTLVNDSDDSGSYNLDSTFSIDMTEIQEVPTKPPRKRKKITPKTNTKGYKPPTKKRKFCQSWCVRFNWLQYDEKKKRMFCRLCLKHAQHSTSYNSFIMGSQSYKLESLTAHAGSIDHQTAEKAQRLYDSQRLGSDMAMQITAKQKFLVKKYLGLYPWLTYRADVQMITCELCQKHTSNTLYLDVQTELQQDVIQRHRSLKLHLVAEVTEAQSWGVVWDTLLAHDVPTDFVTRDLDPRKDMERRSAALFKDTSVRISGTGRELEICNEDVMLQGAAPVIKASPTTSGIRQRVPKTRVRALSSSLTKTPAILRKYGTFRKKWLEEFQWLHYDSATNLMSCKLCQKHRKNNSFTKGVQYFSRDSILTHEKLLKHQDAIKIEKNQTEPTKINNSSQLNNVETSQVQAELVRPMNATMQTNVPVDKPAQYHSNSCVKIAMKPESAEKVLDDEYEELQEAQPLQIVDTEQPSTPKKHTSSEKRVRCFYPNWETQFPWVEYNQEQNAMTCAWCVRYNFKSAFTRGCRSFHIDSLRSHDASTAHKQAAVIHQENRQG